MTSVPGPPAAPPSALVTRLAPVAVAAAVLGLLWTVAGVSGSVGHAVLYFIALVAFCAPGWPAARWMTSEATVVAWRLPLALLLGYAISGLTFLVLRLLTLAGPRIVLATSVALAVLLALALRRRRTGAISLEPFTARDAVALGCLMLVVLAMIGPVFANVGRSTPDGLAYRAYFTADLFAHMTVVAELGRNTASTVNPYHPGEPLPYYYAYFSLPAVYSMLLPGLNVDRGLLFNATAMAMVYTSTWYVVVRSLGASALATALSLVTALGAASFEGAYFLWDHWQRGRDYWGFRNVNIDGLTRWLWWLPPVDGLQRLFWYTPQHGFALTLGLVLFAIVVARAPVRAGARGFIDGGLLGAAFAASSFNGLLLIAWYAATETLELLWQRLRGLLSWLPARVLAAALVLGVLGLTVALGMIQRDAGTLIFGWNRNLLKAPSTFVFLSFGPPLLLAILGVRELARRHARALRGVVTAAGLCAAVLAYVEVPGHLNSYVPFRTGQLFLMMLAILVAFAIDRARRSSAAYRVLFATVMLAGWVTGLPTLVMDAYNASDIDNRGRGPGFPWTVLVTPDDQAALAWIQAHLPPDALVQIDPTARNRASWALIPAFARRHMAAGAPLFLPNPARYKPDVDRVQTLYDTDDASLAYDLAQMLGIDYLYVGALERTAHPQGVAKFLHDPRFELAFQNATVEIFRVVESTSAR